MSVFSEKRFVSVRAQRMAYVERGTGAPIVFLHGNPTSSYLWRNVIPPLAARYRCIAPALIGMGDSGKLLPSVPERYGFDEHQGFLDGWLEQRVPEGPVLLVVHDWGSALGFEWARRFPERVRGIAYMEAIVGVRAWEDFPPPARELFEGLRSPLG